MKLLVTWTVAGMHRGFETWKKPFNPILGETWQASLEGGIDLYMEQVGGEAAGHAGWWVEESSLHTCVCVCVCSVYVHITLRMPRVRVCVCVCVCTQQGHPTRRARFDAPTPVRACCAALSFPQLSHHPPVSAYELVGPGGSWRCSGWSQPAVAPVVKFYGIKTLAKGRRKFEMPDGTSIEFFMPHYAIKGGPRCIHSMCESQTRMTLQGGGCCGEVAFLR
jgi:hypothetical protein